VLLPTGAFSLVPITSAFLIGTMVTSLGKFQVAIGRGDSFVRRAMAMLGKATIGTTTANQSNGPAQNAHQGH
jgi:hypothetical protein